MSDISRLTLEIDSNGVVKANGNLDLFKKKSDEAKNSASSLEKQTKNTSRSFEKDLTGSLIGSMTAGSLMADAIKSAGRGLVELTKNALEASGELEMIKANLTTVMGSAELAQATFEELNTFANRTPFSISGITESAIMLKQSGVAARDLIGTLQALGDAAGGSQEKLNRIAINYAQIMSVGKAATIDIKQFAMAGLPIYDALSNALGVNNEELGKMITQGKVTRDVVVKAFQDMTSEGGTFYKGMERGAATLDGKISTLSDTWKNFLASFSETTGLTESAKNAADIVTSALQGQIDAIELNRKYNEVLKKQINPEVTNIGLNANDYAIISQYKINEYKKQIDQLQSEIDYYQPMGLQDSFLTIDYKKQQDDIKSLMSEEEARLALLNETIAAGKQYDDAEAARIAAEKARAEEEKARLAKEAEEWKSILKKVFSLDEVTTGTKAVQDYESNLEDSLNGALAYAQAFGGNVADVYSEYNDKIKKAVQDLLESGLWTPDEKTIVDLIAFQKRIEDILNTKKGFSTDRSSIFGLYGSQDIVLPGLNDTGGKGISAIGNLAEFGSITGFTLDLANDVNETYETGNSLLEKRLTLAEKIENALKEKNWSEYTSLYAQQTGMNSVSGTDVGTFTSAYSETGSFEAAGIQTLIEAFAKVAQDTEGFDEVMNFVTNSFQEFKPVLEELFTSYKPLLDAGAKVAELVALLMQISPQFQLFITVLKIAGAGVYRLTEFIEFITDKLFGPLKDKVESFDSWLDSILGLNDATEKQTDSINEQIEANKKLVDQLESLREQIKEDELYYAKQRTHLNALYANSSESVSDAIIAPGGKIITTHPDDYLIATKNPGSLGGSPTNVFFSVENYAPDVVSVSRSQRTNDDGSTQIIATLKKVVNSGLASGEFDAGLSARDRRLAGRKVST